LTNEQSIKIDRAMAKLPYQWLLMILGFANAKQQTHKPTTADKLRHSSGLTFCLLIYGIEHGFEKRNQVVFERLRIHF
jgi:hypothetical protein